MYRRSVIDLFATVRFSSHLSEIMKELNKKMPREHVHTSICNVVLSSGRRIFEKFVLFFKVVVQVPV